ncbi:S1 family peptidase [Promicromonospora sp. NPDC052451]|uniref:S1 family peptidase n=1 Tax=Promicromonospora sp. NPDC052451 TaxID=3364407 RepID=UPI0037C9A673
MKSASSSPVRPVPAGRRRPIVLAALLGLVVTPLLALPGHARPSDDPTEDELAELHAAIEESDVEGIAWYTDEAAGEVVVTADETVTGGERNDVRRAAGDKIGALNLERADGVFTPLRAIYPGDAVHGNQVRCSLGFNVRSGARYYFVTAGHCGPKGKVWHDRSSTGPRIGAAVRSWYPNNDYALIRYDRAWTKRPGGFSLGTPKLGLGVTRDGSTSGAHSGRITALDVTVRYVGGQTVHDLIQTDICGEHGDSGGPLYKGNKAFGITSGGTGECPGRGITFFQPIAEVLSTYKLHLY